VYSPQVRIILSLTALITPDEANFTDLFGQYVNKLYNYRLEAKN